MTLTHPERWQLAQDLAQRLVAKYGDGILLGGVYGSTARGTDTPWSDLELWFVTKDDIAVPGKHFLFRGIAAGYEVHTRGALERALLKPTDRWPFCMGVLSVLHVLHGDPSLVERWLSLGRSASQSGFWELLRERLPGLVHESYGRILSCQARGNRHDIGVSVVEVLYEMNEALCLLNQRWVTHDYYQGFREASSFAALPDDYRELVDGLWYASQIDDIVPLAKQLYDNYMRLLEAHGLSAIDHARVEDITVEAQAGRFDRARIIAKRQPHQRKERASMPATMTGRQRILAAMRGEMPDRVPISPRMGVFLSVYYGGSSWMHHLKAADEFGFYICLAGQGPVPAFVYGPALSYPCVSPEVKVVQSIEQQDGGRTIRRTFHTPAGPLSDETFMAPAGREYGVSPSPVKHSHLIESAEDLERLRYVLPGPSTVNMAEFHEIDRIIGDAGILEMTMNPPLDHFLGEARGLTQLMMDYYLDRPFFDQMFAFFQAYSMEVLKAALEQGVRHVFGTWYYASLSAGWSPAIFREIFVPLVRQQVDLVHSYDGIYHAYDDGKMMRTLGDYVSAGVDAIETLTPPPVGDLDLAEAKRLCGDQVCLKGYVDLLYVLKMGTKENVVRTVREAIEIAAPGGRFILGTSDSIREGTPMENVRAYFETAHEYGRYS